MRENLYGHAGQEAAMVAFGFQASSLKVVAVLLFRVSEPLAVGAEKAMKPWCPAAIVSTPALVGGARQIAAADSTG